VSSPQIRKRELNIGGNIRKSLQPFCG